jgi:DNA-binding CsgD family transcriptional regulator
MRGHATVPVDTVAAFLAKVNGALCSVGSDAALAHIAAALYTLVADAPVYFGVYRRDAPPLVMGPDAGDDWNRSYSDGHYLLDPSYEAFLRMTQSLCLLPRDAFPRDFRSSEFYLTFYRPHGMVDEVCYLLRLDADRAAYVSVMRLGGSRAFSSAECQRLGMALPAVEAAMRHACQLHAPATPVDDAGRALHRHLSAAMESFGRDTLSERETEVMRLLLKGLAPKVVGRMLDIAPGTVRNHIKSIYTKLDVRSQAELLAAFFEVLGARG